MLVPLGDRVLVRQSAFCASNAAVVLGPGGSALLVDPGVAAEDLAQLAGELRRRRLTVTAGVVTHPHWDHLVWHPDWGPAPRYAAGACAAAVASDWAGIRAQAAADVPGSERYLNAELSVLPSEADRLPWPGPPIRVLSHHAHAPGHLALFVEGDGVLLAGDLLSDIEIPLLDLDAVDPLGDYTAALRRLADLTPVRVVVPGHGRPGDAGQFRRRLVRDMAYLRGLTGADPQGDPRLARPGAAWMRQHHRAQRRVVRGEMDPAEHTDLS